MKIVIAPDSFKECMTSIEVSKSISRGLKKVFPDAELVCLPVADGGEGTCEALVYATNGEKKYAAVSDPLGRGIKSVWGILGDQKTAVIETASASGLALVEPELRDPRITSSIGTGQLILAALDQGVRSFIIGLGGSATNDCGAGMLTALGAQFLDSEGIPVPQGGIHLIDVESVDLANLDPRLDECTFKIACDVVNELVGEYGASSVFGPQKGATSEMVKQLDNALFHFGSVLEKTSGRDIIKIQGSGAAGGIAAMFIAFFNAELTSGIDLILDAVKFDENLNTASFVITGEGKLDGQSFKGKAPIGVALRAKKFNIPVFLLSGTIEGELTEVYKNGINAAFSVSRGVSNLDKAIRDSDTNIEYAAENIARVIEASNFIDGNKIL